MGCVTLRPLPCSAFRFQRGMLRRAVETGVVSSSGAPVRFVMGDMSQLPFPVETFEVVLSTHSVCPLEDPPAGQVTDRQDRSE